MRPVKTSCFKTSGFCYVSCELSAGYGTIIHGCVDVNKLIKNPNIL